MEMEHAIDGFLLAIRADGYAPATVELYRYVLETLSAFLENTDVEKIKPADLQRYFVFLRDEYQPRRSSGDVSPLAGGSLQNHWKGVRAFFGWAAYELKLKARPDEKLKLPDSNPRVIHPLEHDEIRALLAAAERTAQANPGNRKPFTMKRATAHRDLAIILVLLDTGLRVGELARLTVGDVNMQTGEITVAPYGESRRKTKGRAVFIGKSALKALWRYLAERNETTQRDPLFISKDGDSMNRNSIRHLLTDLGERAGLRENAHPHRFRHTFAIEFLRNGGDVFSLQRILGHSSLDMVRVYLELAQADAQNAHRRASPADRWKL
jgi:integrase/recombinase XerD